MADTVIEAGIPIHAKTTDWIRRCRNRLPTGELLCRAKARIQGHLNYYAITDNSESCELYGYLTRRVLFKWLNRRSQRKSYTWEGFQQDLILIPKRLWVRR